MNPRVNQRQLDVLAWIESGCPDGRWPQHDLTYKTSSVALANRGLVVVKGRGPNWSATITDVGTYYLEHQKYPDGHRPAPKPPPLPPTYEDVSAPSRTQPEPSPVPTKRRHRRGSYPSPPPPIASPNHMKGERGELPDGKRPPHPWDDKVLVTVKEAAWLLSVGEGMIRKAANDGDVERVFVGLGTTHYRIVHASLLAWVNTMPREPVRHW